MASINFPASLSSSEIAIAYANEVSQVSSAEITSGNETALRTYAPVDVVAFIAQHETDGGPTTFTGLTDAPATYTGNANRLVAVNGAEDALEFIASTGAVLSEGEGSLSAEMTITFTEGDSL